MHSPGDLPLAEETASVAVPEPTRVLAESDFLERAPPARHRPAIWPAFAVLGAAFALIILSQIVAGIALAVWAITQGVPAPQIAPALMELLATPWAFIGLGIGSQAAMLAAALFAARFAREPIRERLALNRPGLSTPGLLAVAFGSWVPLALSLGLAFSLPEGTPSDPAVAKMYEAMTWSSALPFLLFISLAPGFCEEVLFRGYVQRQFLARWSPWTAILVTSVLFALFHIMPHGIAVAFPLGVWLGWLAWKTDSVWPGIVCHAFVNGSWNAYQIGARLDLFPEDLPLPVLVAIGLVAVTGFALSLYVVGKYVVGKRPSSHPVW